MSALCQKATSAATRESEIELTCERELQWECQLLGGRFHETSTQTISTSRRGCRRAAGYFAKRIRARLPDAAGAVSRRFPRGSYSRHHRAYRRSSAVRAAW